MLWETAKKRKLTLDQAVEMLEQKGYGKWGINTVKAAVEGKSKELRENVLRIVLKEFLGFADSAIDRPAESAQSGVAGFQDRRESEPVEQWRQRAIIAEERLKQIAGIATAPISSTGDSVYRVVKKSVAGSNENAPTPKSE